jgi:hypothetical protein
MRPILDFTTHPHLSQLIADATRHPGTEGLLTLLRATAAGRIAFVSIINRRAIWTSRDLKSSLPTVILVSDDAGDSRNPNEWRCFLSVSAWARTAVVHGTGARHWHYDAVVEAAQRAGRCLVIETDSDHAGAWAAALAPREIPTLVITPPSGGIHPVGAEA